MVTMRSTSHQSRRRGGKTINRAMFLKRSPTTAGCTTAKFDSARYARNSLIQFSDEDRYLSDAWNDRSMRSPSKTDSPCPTLATSVACKQLEEVGCAAVMPRSTPIGSGLGVRNPYTIAIIKGRAKVRSLLMRASAQHGSAIAMELGVDALLMNTGIAAQRSRTDGACDAQRRYCGPSAFLAGRMGTTLRKRIEPDARPHLNQGLSS